MKTIDQIIDDVIEREGGYVNDPNDPGGRTIYGITERDFPGEWNNGPPSLERAKQVYAQKFVHTPGFDKIPDMDLAEQLIDYGVNSGPFIAIQKLQLVVGVPQDGVLGPATLDALAHMDSREVNNKVAGERIKMLGRIVTKNRNMLGDLNGWLTRATSFLR